MGEGPQVPGSTPLASPQTLLALINGNWTTQVLYVAAKLGLADLLAEGPQPAEALAQATATRPEALRRLLWGLTSLGICVEGEDGRFALTPLGGYLRSGVPGSVRQSAIFRGEGLYQTWGHLLHSVQTGEPASPLVREAPTADEFQRHPEVAATFHRSQTEQTQVVAEALVGAYDFSRFGTLVDVGGGYGALVLTILQAHPTLRGVVFDREHAMAGARQTIAAHGCTERCEAVAGDFFQAVPGGGDAYLLKSVLTNWDEARSTVILRNCRRAAPQARLLVVEPIRPTPIEPSVAHQAPLAIDLNMLVATGGEGRSEAEFRRLFSAAGYHLGRTLPTALSFSLLEGVPA
jgi:orsellinic acid C2-O-methyltransferase